MTKSFKGSLPRPTTAAMQFISEANPQPEPEVQATEPIAHSETPDYEAIQAYIRLHPECIEREKRTRRTHIVLTPSLYEETSEQASKAGISMNEYIIRAIVTYNETRGATK